MFSKLAAPFLCVFSSSFLGARGLETHFSNWDPIDDELEWEEMFGAETVYRTLKKSNVQHAPHLEKGDNASVHGIGRLMYSNKTFWQTHPGQPHQFIAGKGEVVGWHVGTIHMLEGERRLIRIPAEEAHQAQLHHAWDVPDGADLELEIELISIEGKDQEWRAAHGLQKDDIQEEIEGMIQDYPVLVFCDTSTRSMRMKMKISEALQHRDIHDYRSVELSRQPDYLHWVNHLETLTGVRGLPLLFIGGKYHGDVHETADSHQDGSLSDLLDKVVGKKHQVHYHDSEL